MANAKIISFVAASIEKANLQQRADLELAINIVDDEIAEVRAAMEAMLQRIKKLENEEGASP